MVNQLLRCVCFSDHSVSVGQGCVVGWGVWGVCGGDEVLVWWGGCGRDGVSVMD